MKRGFTLIELLVVIAIIGVLSSIIIANINQARARSRDAHRVMSIKQLQTALELYFNDNDRYPNSSVGNSDVLFSDSAITTALTPKYISQMPVDPINTTPYRYYTGGQNPATFYAIRITYENKAACYVCGGPVLTCSSGNGSWWGLYMCQ